MNVYFTTGYENPKKSIENINTTLNTIKQAGNSITKRPLKSEHGASTYSVNENNYKNIFDFLDLPIEKVYSQATSRIKQADVVITEASYFLSPGVGFELGFALHEKKPVLVLINKDSDVVLSEVIEGNPSKLFSSVRYSDKEDLVKKINKFLSEAKKKLDTKFILIISPEIDRYLEWASEFRRMHKAQVVRESVEAVMKKDKEYKAYLNSQ